MILKSGRNIQYCYAALLALWGISMSEDTLENNSYNNIKRISDEELEALWADYLNNRQNKVLRDKLIIQYIYLTKYVVGRIKINLPPTFSIEDIASSGVEGLIDAVEKFTPQKGARFESYALMRIKGNIIDKIRREDIIPRNIRRKIKEIQSTAEELRKKLGRPATSSEIGEQLGLSAEKVNEILAEDTTTVSLYEKKGTQDESVELIDTLEDKRKLPFEMLAEKDTKKELQRALNKLPEREKTILVLYYHENLTLKEIGEAISMSESRVCQLHSQAIMKLRNFLSQNRAERMQMSII